MTWHGCKDRETYLIVYKDQRVVSARYISEMRSFVAENSKIYPEINVRVVIRDGVAIHHDPEAATRLLRTVFWFVVLAALLVFFTWR